MSNRISLKGVPVEALIEMEAYRAASLSDHLGKQGRFPAKDAATVALATMTAIIAYTVGRLAEGLDVPWDEVEKLAGDIHDVFKEQYSDEVVTRGVTRYAEEVEAMKKAVEEGNIIPLPTGRPKPKVWN